MAMEFPSGNPRAPRGTLRVSHFREAQSGIEDQTLLDPPPCFRLRQDPRVGIYSIKIWKLIHIDRSVTLDREAPDIVPFDKTLLMLINYKFIPGVNTWHGFRSLTP
jgi:hypothetical protein